MDINSQNIPDFQTIFEEFYQKVMRYITHMVGEADAEDLTQEIFIKINKAIDKFRGESKLSTWVYKVATNAALDHIHSSDYKQKSTTIPNDSEVLEVIDQNAWTSENVPVPEDQVARKELSACVQEYIQNMS